MGVFYETIPENISSWILEQKMFWVATAPLSRNHHINVSPKGGSYFGLLSSTQFWYMDLSGSGTETIAHLRENGRITVMFNAFSGPPRIVRLWGHGRVLERGNGEFEAFVEKEGVQVIPASRSIVLVDVHQVGSSCGYSVPLYEFRDFRKTLNQVFEKKEKDFERGKSVESKDRYWAYKNAWSIDGLPGMKRGLDCGMRELVAPIEKMIGPFAPPAPYGPKSWKLGNQIRYQMAALNTTQVQLKTVLAMLLVAFVLGILVTSYAPQIVTSQRGLLKNILM